MRRLVLLATIVLLVLAAAGCGSGKQSSAQSRQLTDLHDIGQLRSLFDTRSGEPRLILLASPT